MLGDIASVATAIAVILAVAGLRQTQRQRVRQFEDFYVKRYWDLMDRLSLGALRDQRASNDEDRKALYAYLLLCEDELDLRAEGWISDSTWKVWGNGIKSQLSCGPADEVWNAVMKKGETGTDISFDQLRRFMTNGGEDPFPKGVFPWWFVRRIRGLRGFFTQ